MCDPSWTTMLAAEDTAAESNTVLLQTFRAWVTGDKKCAYVRGVIDGGSQQTFIREDMAHKLRLNVLGNITVSLNTFGSTASTPQRQRCNVVEVRLRSQFAPTEFTVQAITVPFICRDICQTPVEHELVRSIRAEDGYIADELLFPDIPAEFGVSLLLGCDQLWKLTTGKIRRSASTSGLVAIETSLGWTFQGPTSAYGGSSDSNVMICVLKTGVYLQDETATSLRTLWELESIGIIDDSKNSREIDDRVWDDFRQNVTMQEGRYVVALPWKSAECHLHDNREVAQSRLVKLVRRLEKERALDEYDGAIRSYLDNGHAERVPVETSEDDRTYFILHASPSRCWTGFKVHERESSVRRVFSCAWGTVAQ
ncbi:uncharacterized protein LOC135374046 [Ornithodoros turicata]|uniref:uncharacterized protein LOC135374046 n=1 Tax=Ornithodoros turicata TaxID=34597 RepID=UPI00313A0B74